MQKASPNKNPDDEDELDRDEDGIDLDNDNNFDMAFGEKSSGTRDTIIAK